MLFPRKLYADQAMYCELQFSLLRVLSVRKQAAKSHKSTANHTAPYLTLQHSMNCIYLNNSLNQIIRRQQPASFTQCLH
jgi:hypothetical protein